MYRIPHVVPFREDELLASWVMRLSKENCFEDVRRFVFNYFYPNREEYNYLSMKMDFRDVLYHFWRALPSGSIEPEQLLLELTTFPGIAPLLSKDQRQRYLCQCFYIDSGKEKLFPQPHGFYHSLKVCPTCMEEEIEEYGDYYFHRAHQMPGVTVCHRHGTALLSLSRFPKTLDSIPKGKPLQVPDDSLDYAGFCKDFLDARFDFSSDTVADLVEKGVPGDMPFNEKIKNILPDVRRLELSQIRKGMSPEKVLKLLFLVFGNVESTKKMLPEPENGEGFASFAADLGYTLESDYRNDVVALRHKDCGKSFCVSPHGFKIGWRCPFCLKDISIQKQFEKLVGGLGNGEYEVVGEFESMDSLVPIKHMKCGKVSQFKARSFIYEGVRCECEYTVGEAEVRNNIEKHCGFRLVEYTTTDKPLTIEHEKCGSRFRISYSKFLKAPRCRVCERQGHINVRTDEDFRRDIKNLTGNEYSLAGHYNGPRNPIAIRHNVCNRIHEYKPYYFLDGGRCPYCSSKNVSFQMFCEYVIHVSYGRYSVTGRPSRNLYEITDSKDGSVLHMSRNRILQELNRPTTSPVLPLSKKRKKELLNKTHILLGRLKALYPEGGLMFTEDIREALDADKSIFNLLRSLLEERFLECIAPGVYAFSGEYSPSDVINAKYLVRGGKRIGYLRCEDYAHEIGLMEKPVEWHIVTNKESAKTPSRCISFMGESIHIKGSPYEINNDNYLILSALDFLMQYRQVVDAPEEDVIAHVRDYIRENNGGHIPPYEEFEKYMKYKKGNITTMMERRVRRLTDASAT